MTRTAECDVAVVGAGFAGLAAALRARELGADVLLMERTRFAPSWSNSRMAGGRYHVAMLDPDADAALIERRVLDMTDGCAREETVHALAHENGRAFRWTQGHGVRYVRIGRGVLMAPVRPNHRGNVWRGRGPDRSLRVLFEAYTRRGGRYEQEVRATEIVTDGGRVSGLRALAAGGALEVRARSIVLADGGFQGDVDLLQRYARVSNVEAVLQRGASTGCGDGLRMAERVGARLVNTEALYGHLVHADALTDPELSPYPMLDRLAAGAVLVGPDADRFCDESLGGVHAVNRLVRTTWRGPAWLVFDREAWWTAGRLDQIVPPNPNLVRAGARIFSGATSKALAESVGLPAAALARTIDEFNAAMRGGSATLAVPRSKRARPIDPPLYAVPVRAGVTFTMGGPLIDGSARVLNDADRPIPGLCAAGSGTGGLAGGATPGYAGGISVALTFGMIAGETAAAAVTRAE